MQATYRTRVLILDDNPHTARLIEVVLTGAGLEVRKCSDARIALEALELWPCDAVVTDYEMKPLQGPDFVRLLRKHPRESIRQLAVLMITAFADQAHVLDARNAGVDGLIQKPFGAGLMLERLQSVLERSQERRAA